jgi:hypothetical protein
MKKNGRKWRKGKAQGRWGREGKTGESKRSEQGKLLMGIWVCHIYPYPYKTI